MGYGNHDYYHTDTVQLLRPVVGYGNHDYYHTDTVQLLRRVVGYGNHDYYHTDTVQLRVDFNIEGALGKIAEVIHPDELQLGELDRRQETEAGSRWPKPGVPSTMGILINIILWYNELYVQ